MSSSDPSGGSRGVEATPSSYAKPSLIAVAHHEAAHAVAHLKLGLPGELQYVEIDDQIPRGGHTHIVRALSPTQTQAVSCIVQNLVGSPAEERIDRDPSLARSGADSDYENASRYVRLFGISEDWGVWERDARIFVSRNWCLISAVARELLRQPWQGQRKRIAASRIHRLTTSRWHRLTALVRSSCGF